MYLLNHLWRPKVTSMQCSSVPLVASYGTETKWLPKIYDIYSNIWRHITTNGHMYSRGLQPMPRRIPAQGEGEGRYRPVSPVWTHSWLARPRHPLQGMIFGIIKCSSRYIGTNFGNLLGLCTSSSASGVAKLLRAILVSLPEFLIIEQTVVQKANQGRVQI
jgi:hypothetical protein